VTASERPSGVNAATPTHAESGARRRTSSPDFRSQSWTGRFRPEVARRAPSGERATAKAEREREGADGSAATGRSGRRRETAKTRHMDEDLP
jgi:hypothetical protein